MVIEACTCDQGAGLPHDHQYTYDNIYGVWGANPIPYLVRMWVDWKAVAKGLGELTIATSSDRGNETLTTTPTLKPGSAVA